MKSEKSEHEIESLNIDDLDIEELERRIELAAAIPQQQTPGCENYKCPNLDCQTDCYNYDIMKKLVGIAKSL